MQCIGLVISMVVQCIGIALLMLSTVVQCTGIALFMITIVVQCIRIALLIISIVVNGFYSFAYDKNRCAMHWNCIAYDKHSRAME